MVFYNQVTYLAVQFIGGYPELKKWMDYFLKKKNSKYEDYKHDQ
jgi:hypothetical protein